MLAALEIVDYVALNRWPSAVEMLKIVSPDVYAKGPDYKNHQADLTGRIGEEEAAAVFKHLAPKEVQRLGETLARMKSITRERMDGVLDKFAAKVRGTEVNAGRRT